MCRVSRIFDIFILSQNTNFITHGQVEPAKIVDEIIKLVVDTLTPGRGAGESSWWVYNHSEKWKSLEILSEECSCTVSLTDNWNFQIDSSHNSNAIFLCMWSRWMRTWRSLEHQSEKSSRELDIRSNLRDWDNEFPYLHHELVVRYAVGFLAYNVATSLYGGLTNRSRGQKRQYFR